MKPSGECCLSRQPDQHDFGTSLAPDIRQSINGLLCLQSFSSVVGPNGSGKSNVIDAMLFVFGKKAKQVAHLLILVLTWQLLWRTSAGSI